jgi:hypothetical protein
VSKRKQKRESLVKKSPKQALKSFKDKLVHPFTTRKQQSNGYTLWPQTQGGEWDKVL